MKNPTLLTFTLRDLIICVVYFFVMIAITIAHDMVKGWRFWLIELVLALIMAAIMIYTDSKLEKK